MWQKPLLSSPSKEKRPWLISRHFCRYANKCKMAVRRPTLPPQNWAEGMAGLSTLMSCCSEMGGALSEEDKVLFSTLQQIQGRLAASTTVVDSSDRDQEMADAGSQSTRDDGDSEASAQAKRQRIIAYGIQQPPKENEAGTGSANGVGVGVVVPQQSVSRSHGPVP